MARVLAGLASCGFALLASGVARAEDTHAAGTAAGASVKAAPKMVAYDRHQPVRVAMLVAGSTVLAPSYLAPCALAGSHWCIPYAGPIVALVKYNRRVDQQEASSSNQGHGMVSPAFAKAVVDTLLVEVAAVQLVSTALLVTGILIPRREVLEPAYTLKLGRHVALTPVAAPSAVGLVASGSF